MPGVFPSRTHAGQRCPLPFGLPLGLLSVSFLLFVACASPPPDLTPPQAHNVPRSPFRIAVPLNAAPDQSSTPATLVRHTGLSIVPVDVPSGLELEAWVESLAHAGVTLILLDAGTREGVRLLDETRPMEGLGSVYFRTGLAQTARDVFGEVVPIAHRYGLSVFAAVSLRRMNWIDPTLGWMDRAYDPVQQQLRITPYLDVFHPAFQEYLTGLFLDLADTGINGVLFRNDAPLGPTDGFSVFALRGFERDFQIKADPDKLAPIPVRASPITEEGVQPQVFKPNTAPEFWQWAGWKAREMIKLTVKLEDAMRSHAPNLSSAIEVHPEAVIDPLIALLQYGEDLLDAKRNGIQFFFIRTQNAQNAPAAPFLDRMGQLVGQMERIWISVPLPGGDTRNPDQWPPFAKEREGLERGIGLIYMGN